MPRYAVIRQGAFVESRFYPEPVPADQIKYENGLPQLRPLTEDKPAYDPVTEVLEGPTHQIADALVTATWTKRAKTAQELAAEKDARVEAALGGPLDRKIRLALHNRLRALEGLADHSPAQFKAWVAGL